MRKDRYRLPKLLADLFPLEQSDIDLPPQEVAEVLAVWIYVAELDLPTRPLLILTGPPGSGKTSLARGIVRLVEGPDADVLVLPKSPQDLEVVAARHRYLALDNIESRAWLPDVLAAVATGARQEGRQLYSNNTVTSISIRASVAITSMDVPFGRADILDRCIVLPMRRLGAFLPESEVQRRIDAARPGFKDALEDDVGRLAPQVDGSPEPGQFRMADFAAVGACVWGSRGPRILNALAADQASVLLRDDPVVEALLAVVRSEGPIRGSASVIRALVIPHLHETSPEMRTAKAFGDHLRRLAEPTRHLGLSITWTHDRHRKSFDYTITTTTPARGRGR